MHVCAVHKSQTGVILKSLLYYPLYLPPISTNSGSCIHLSVQCVSGQLTMFRFLPLTHSLNPSVIPLRARNCIDRSQDKKTNNNIHMVPACGTYDFPVSLTEINEHLAIALSHVLRHGKDTGYIVVEE